ncbi:hypothetical protein ALC56_09230 [Trachymyrmex septentrionalis]|uniref:Uncharacterized protein n=1 Tax=Trachymyrmex septentrionalis TaxID=34720 RepID=A0A195F6P6_9HYME|nr:hypothetical protein ALC56_09230 [Trachymyrmex septentrionalis]
MIISQWWDSWIRPVSRYRGHKYIHEAEDSRLVDGEFDFVILSLRKMTRGREKEREITHVQGKNLKRLLHKTADFHTVLQSWNDPLSILKRGKQIAMGVKDFLRKAIIPAKA